MAGTLERLLYIIEIKVAFIMKWRKNVTRGDYQRYYEQMYDKQ